MPIVESEFAPLRDPRIAAQLMDHALGSSPAWLWSTDGSRILWANAVAAAIFGAADAVEMHATPVRGQRPGRGGSAPAGENLAVLRASAAGTAARLRRRLRPRSDLHLCAPDAERQPSRGPHHCGRAGGPDVDAARARRAAVSRSWPGAGGVFIRRYAHLCDRGRAGALARRRTRYPPLDSKRSLPKRCPPAMPPAQRPQARSSSIASAAMPRRSSSSPLPRSRAKPRPRNRAKPPRSPRRRSHRPRLRRRRHLLPRHCRPLRRPTRKPPTPGTASSCRSAGIRCGSFGRWMPTAASWSAPTNSSSWSDRAPRPRSAGCGAKSPPRSGSIPKTGWPGRWRHAKPGAASSFPGRWMKVRSGCRWSYRGCRCSTATASFAAIAVSASAATSAGSTN